MHLVNKWTPVTRSESMTYKFGGCRGAMYESENKFKTTVVGYSWKFLVQMAVISLYSTIAEA